jgi:dTDP-4-amino-4,6-dideoxygalactose transaminase
MELAAKYNLFVVEDAAQSIDAYYLSKDGTKKALGSIGHLAAFSFHETKNIISGEGGMLVINDDRFAARAEIIWEKGTNRSAFFRGEIDKYGWVDIGSSFLPSDIIAAFLFAQLECLENIQQKRLEIWQYYNLKLKQLELNNNIRLPYCPENSTNNAHMFYIICKDLNERSALIAHLKSKQINAVFHYISLHKSPYYKDKHDGRVLSMVDFYSDTLLRLPMYYELEKEDLDRICNEIESFYSNYNL